MTFKQAIVQAIASADDGCPADVLVIPNANQLVDLYVGSMSGPTWISGVLHKRGNHTAFLAVEGMCQGLPLTRTYRRPRGFDTGGFCKTALFAYVVDFVARNG